METRPDWKGGAATARGVIACARALVVAALGIALGSPDAVAAQGSSEIRSVIEGLATRPQIAGAAIPSVDDVAGIYARSGYAPLWSRAQSADALRDVLLGAARDGLDPAAYHLTAIDALAARRDQAGTRAAAELDVLRTSAVIQLARDLRWGRARPASVAPVSAAADSALLARIGGAGDLAAEIDALRPDHFTYRGLVAALARLRAIEQAGGWITLPAGEALRAGDSGVPVARLRERLAAEGYLARAVGTSADFDATLDEAVRSFQHHHGLNEDGIVGAATLAELNVPVAARIAQVVINLERARWIAPTLPCTRPASSSARTTRGRRSSARWFSTWS
jgi:murein L,D-transpeptidase YcbB/YkuD